eukprot:scaffold11886_cov63-Phaeocystis_antarctica.AAC.1
MAPPPPPQQPPAPPPPPPVHRQCYLTVSVANTDYNAANEYVVSTTANGVEVHGKCSPYSDDGTVLDGGLDGRDFFVCAKNVPLPISPDSTYSFVTTATDFVNENKYEGSYVYVEYMVDCVGTCQAPSAPPLAPTCAYSATPAGGGNSSNVSSTFTDPHAPMPLPPPTPPAPPTQPSPPLPPAPLGGYSPPPPGAPPP